MTWPTKFRVGQLKCQHDNLTASTTSFCGATKLPQRSPRDTPECPRGGPLGDPWYRTYLLTSGISLWFTVIYSIIVTTIRLIIMSSVCNHAAIEKTIMVSVKNLSFGAECLYLLVLCKKATNWTTFSPRAGVSTWERSLAPSDWWVDRDVAYLGILDFPHTHNPHCTIK